MQQVIQNIRTGALEVARLPAPVARPGHVLIANRYSLISAGTEKTARELAQKSLLAKARERPDHVRRVLEKMRSEGVWNTLQQVQQKLDEPMPLGYCSSGVVLACGAGVSEVKPGDAVASNGGHAEVVCVPKHLCARVPIGVGLDQAAFTVLGAIALHGLRLSRIALGESALVIGLGLVGQLTVALLKSAGARVLGTDLDAAKCALALRMGADVARPGLAARDVLAETNERGADVVLITASTKSNGPVELAGEAVRQKGRVVAVGAVGMDLPRRAYYFKEAEFVVSCSYGPGRYDPRYEEHGLDYPPAYVRWTEQRNMQAVLDLMAAGQLDVGLLISHRFAIAQAARAFELIETGTEPFVGVLIEYPDTSERTARKIELRARGTRGRVAIGCLGAGSFARGVLLPKLCALPQVQPEVVCSAGGLSSSSTGRTLGFASASTQEADVLDNPELDAVFVLTQHDQHARQVLRAIRSGKHVFVEKPLCLTAAELEAIEAELLGPASAHADSARAAPLVMVGFNRRFSPAAQAVRQFFASVVQPLTVSVRFNAGAIPEEHWTQDEAIGGGRIIGEACHAIDLAIYLTGSTVERVFAESIGGPRAPRVTDDQCFITLRHANGSVSNVAYLAGGDKAYPKERVEVLGGGQVAVIEDFRRAEGWSGGRRQLLWKGTQDKGHTAELQAFIEAIAHGGEAPIPWHDIRSTTWASLLAVQSIREGFPFDLSAASGPDSTPPNA